MELDLPIDAQLSNKIPKIGNEELIWSIKEQLAREITLKSKDDQLFSRVS